MVNIENNNIPLNDNILPLEAAKENKKLKAQIKEHSRYLKALSFSQIIDETSSIIEELNNSGPTQEMIQKSKITLEEFAKRIKSSHGPSESFIKMKKKLQSKLKEFHH